MPTMHTITDSALAVHLEAALAVAPERTLVDLQHPDSRRRRCATVELARHLADRLGCYEFRFEDAEGEQPGLFGSN